jgi:hypothetical protein
MEAVGQSGIALEYASSRLKKKAGIVLEAIYKHVSLLKRTDKVSRHDHPLSFASYQLKGNISFVRSVVLLHQDIPRSHLHILIWSLHGKIIKRLFDFLSFVHTISEGKGEMISFIEEEGKGAAAKVVSFTRERLWLLGQVCGPIPTSIMKLVYEFCDRDISKEVKKAINLSELAPIVSALEYIGMTWKDILHY